MTSFYTPYPQQPQQPQQDPNYLVLPDGTEVFFGPYNHEQAPSLECDSCGTPITVGQTFFMMPAFRLGVTRAGQLMMIPLQEWNDPQNPKYVHESCTAEYAHDQITKEPCGADDAGGVCMYCDSRLNGDDEP